MTLKEVANEYAETHYPRPCNHDAYSGARNGFMAGFNYAKSMVEEMRTKAVNAVLSLCEKKEIDENHLCIKKECVLFNDNCDGNCESFDKFINLLN